ncbi:MAG TPA: hypothetical protein VHY22_18185 [Chthoniobacteraceae bacterium]|jgi:hypothetical protein|nr:hypothetical protein [Chthoniobacteraceae bacterium]
MFDQVLVQDWQNLLSIAATILFIIAFAMALLRVFTLDSKALSHAENLPLEPESRANH